MKCPKCQLENPDVRNLAAKCKEIAPDRVSDRTGIQLCADQTGHVAEDGLLDRILSR
jgi:hypothetical protein